MNARFYAPDAERPGDLVALPDDEAQHLTRVLRVKAGQGVEVINGRGAAFAAVVETAARDTACVRIGDRVAAAREPLVAITLAQAVLKADKMDEVVRDAVMIGVAAIQPVLTTRSEVAAATLSRGRRRDRWARIAVSSAKQCGRAVVPPVHEPTTFAALTGGVGRLEVPSPALMLVEPGASADLIPLRDLDAAAPREASLLVGPEGGWTPDEIAAGQRVCRMMALGGRTLRADAMATVAVAALFAHWKEY